MTGSLLRWLIADISQLLSGLDFLWPIGFCPHYCIRIEMPPRSSKLRFTGMCQTYLRTPRDLARPTQGLALMLLLCVLVVYAEITLKSSYCCNTSSDYDE